MPNYLMIYRGGGLPETEEQGLEEMQKWGAWMERFANNFADPGNPVGKSYTVSKDAHQEGAVEPAMGYSIFKADSIEEALEAAKTSPHHNFGGFVEVAEIIPIEM